MYFLFSQEYLFIPLDIFCICVQDKDISNRNELEAWFTFLVAEKPEEIGIPLKP